MFGLNTHDISTIIFTSLTSALITGVVVYLIQKSIENSFTKKLEEFRARLELSVFQKQTKFTKNYQESTKTILDFHQKLVTIRNDFDNYVILYKKAKNEKKSSGNKAVINKQVDKIDHDLSDLINFKDKNNIHLSQELSMKTDELAAKITLFFVYLSTAQISKNKPEIIQHIVGMNEILKIDISESAFQNITDLHQQIISNINQLIDEFENLYRDITT